MVWFWSILIKFRSTSIYDFPCLSNVKIAASFTLFPSGVAAFGVTFSTPTKDFGTLHVHSILRLSTPQLRCFLLTRKKKREASRFAVWLRTHQSSSANHMAPSNYHWLYDDTCYHRSLVWTAQLLHLLVVGEGAIISFFLANLLLVLTT